MKSKDIDNNDENNVQNKDNKNYFFKKQIQ